MQALEVLSKVRSLGVEVHPSGDRLRFHPASALTPELIAGLKEHKAEIIDTLSEEIVESPTDVLSIAREVLPPLGDEDRVNLAELVRANQPPTPGRDPMTKHETDKAHFFHAPADCGCDVCMPLPRYAQPWKPTVYEGGKHG